MKLERVAYWQRSGRNYFADVTPFFSVGSLIGDFFLVLLIVSVHYCRSWMYLLWVSKVIQKSWLGIFFKYLCIFIFWIWVLFLKSSFCCAHSSCSCSSNLQTNIYQCLLSFHRDTVKITLIAANICINTYFLKCKQSYKSKESCGNSFISALRLVRNLSSFAEFFLKERTSVLALTGTNPN